MAVQNFAVELIEGLLARKELGLTEQDIRFYDKGTVVEDEQINDHIRWKNARHYNETSNVVRSSLLIVQLLSEDKGVSEFASLNVGDLYRSCRKKGLEAVLDEVTDLLKPVKNRAAVTRSMIDSFSSYESVKERLILRPLNYDNNTQTLSNAIYRQVGDMALVLYISIGNFVQGDQSTVMSTMVRQELFDTWGLGAADREPVLELALQNTLEQQPPVLIALSGLSMDQPTKTYDNFMEDQSLEINFDQAFAPILSTKQEINGSIAAFYPGVMERLYQMIGRDYYLVFSGISEVHIHPVDGVAKLSSMRRSLQDVNTHLNRQDELLSRSIYRYHGDIKELTVV